MRLTCFLPLQAAEQQQQLQALSGSLGSMQHVLEEAGRLLKLLWRVSLPAGGLVGDASNQQDELLKSEIARLKSRLSQQERMLSGAVKRLRTTNQLKEGMERVIIDQRKTHAPCAQISRLQSRIYIELTLLHALSSSVSDPRGPEESQREPRGEFTQSAPGL